MTSFFDKIENFLIKNSKDETDTQNCNEIVESSLLCILILFIPASTCSTERSFSALWRIKSYLRSTLRAYKLNHVAVLQVHRDYLDQNQCREIVKRVDFKKSSQSSYLSYWKNFVVAFLDMTRIPVKSEWFFENWKMGSILCATLDTWLRNLALGP